MLFSVIWKAASFITILSLTLELSSAAIAQTEESYGGQDTPVDIRDSFSIPSAFGSLTEFPESGGGGNGDITPSPGDIQTIYNSAGLDVLDASAFGDNIDIDTGALSFQHIDVSLPGNSSLPVAIIREMSRGTLDGLGSNADSGGFNDWMLAVPHVRQKYLNTNGRPLPEAPSGYYGPQSDRCTTDAIGGYHNFLRIAFTDGTSAIDESVVLQKHEFYDGLTLMDAGGGSHPLLINRSSEFTSNGQVPRLISKDNWTVECLPSTLNNQGEGWIAKAPNGNTYKFNYAVYYITPQITWPNPAQPVYQEALYVSEITDVHGNWVRYDYSGSRLIRIHANDGRRIDIAYNTDRTIRSIKTESRTWSYAYAGKKLSRVTLPDGTYWEMGALASSGDHAPFQPAGPNNEVCLNFNWQDYRVKHPHGAQATFSFTAIRNGKYKLIDPIRNHDYGPHLTTLPNVGSCGPAGFPVSHPSFFRSIAVTRKSVNIPQDGTHVWTWEYEQDAGSFQTYTQGVPLPRATSPTKTRKTTKPDGSFMVTHVNRQFGKMEGQIEKVESFDSSGNLLQTEVFSYAYGNMVGVGMGQNIRQFAEASRFRVYQTSSILSRDGESYTTSRDFQTNPAASDFAYGEPRRVEQSSSLNSGTRITETTFEHKKDKWVLGLPKTITRNGKLFTTNTYNSLGRLTRTDQFGVQQAAITYNTDGTIDAVTDAINRTSRFKGWHRGQAQRFELPASTVITQTIDNNGWITSQTDAKGNMTSLTYDVGGRVTRVARPGILANINIAYIGLGTGNLTRTVTEGSKSTITKHDGFLRPYEIEQRALIGGGGSIFNRTEYDGLGRPVFQSFPQANLAATTVGLEISYDGLGRVTQARENVAPFATTTTQFLSSNRTRYIDAEGHVTMVTSSGFGNPGDGSATRIQRPNSLVTDMVYDIYGNLRTATQGGKTQNWWYDVRQRVCAQSTSETGTKRFQYDNANQLIAHADIITGNYCGTLPSSATVVYTYDLLGQISSVKYPDSLQNIYTNYDANGNVKRKSRNGSVWDYTYDAADQLLSETLRIDGRTYATSYSYNNIGALTGLKTPTGLALTYSVDGFGRPTGIQAGSTIYAFNGAYHPNGTIRTVLYGHAGEGQSRGFSNILNARQKISRRIQNGAYIADYVYDKNGRITEIDHFYNDNRDKTYTYDGAGRLVAATGIWGSASYTYDARNNITSKHLGTRAVSMIYNSKNQLSSVSDSARPNRTYAYDTRGNVINDGRHSFVYDYANQPISMGGANTASFRYDGNYKRVKQTINGKTIYSVYGAGGQILYRDNATNGESTDFIHFGSTLVATKTGNEIEYKDLDHLGTPIITEKVGSSRRQKYFTPFGEEWSSTDLDTDEPGFTGHIADTDTGLTYMQARYYDPVIGRFLSNDPVGFAEGGVQYFNRYAYTANDPVNAIDPDGEFFQLIVGAASAVGGAAIDAAIQGVEIASGQRESFDGLQTLRAGAISGATGLAAATCGVCAVGVAAGLSGTEQAGVALVQGDSVGTALGKGAVGATIGAVTAGKGAGLGNRATSGLAVKALKGEVSTSAPFAAQSAISAGASQGLSGPLNSAGANLVDTTAQGLSDLGGALSDAGTELVNSIESGCGVTPSGPC